MPPATDSDLQGLLSPAVTPRVVEPGIWSVLPHGSPARYDARVKAYDAVVGSQLYNDFVWGSSASKYRRFAESCMYAGSNGWHLDAGCGTLIFSARAYSLHPDRPVVLLDHSLGMLRQARARLRRVAPHRQAPLVLLQADLQDLPFRDHVFETVLSMGVLHLFPDPERVLAGLNRVLAPSGSLFLNSLVLGRRLGNAYLHVLHFCGEVARPRSAAEIRALVHSHVPGVMSVRQKGSMLFVETRRA
jgi:ubiquinone/menaquinone biosynthesis C-methylase UbiE